jgi:4-amino-4-deoxy-L-arabinose transferase-like glycosyltransferase
MVAGARTFSLEETFLSPQILNPPPTRHALLAFLLALAAILHIGTAAWGDLYDGTEGQLSGGAREILDSGQWLMPTNNGEPILEAPPFSYWALALSYKIFGVTPAAARLPVALAMLGSVAFTFLIGERLAGYWRGFSAGLIYVLSVSAFVLGRIVTPNAIFSFFIAGAIYCMLRGYQHPKFRRPWFAGCWFAAALACLTKGPSALLYLGLILGGLSMFFREARFRFRALLHWSNLALFLAIVLPWFVWAYRTIPGFPALFFSSAPTASLPRGRLLLGHLAWWFPALFMILPGLIFAPRKIFRPNETSFVELLPLAWIAVGLLAALLPSQRRAFSALAAAPGFALFAAAAWQRTSRKLRAAGIVLSLVLGLAFAAVTCLRPAIAAGLIERSLDGGAWPLIAPLVPIAIVSLVVFFVIALLIMKQRGETTLAVALAAMLPIGFCLVESRSRAAPFFSLADVAQLLDARLGRTGEVVYEGSLHNGSSLTFYLDKKFYLVNQPPPFSHQNSTSPNRYLDEHFLLEAWDGSNPIYLIIDESRVSYWRTRITHRVHIYHQVTTCGSRVVLSNQL